MPYIDTDDFALALLFKKADCTTCPDHDTRPHGTLMVEMEGDPADIPPMALISILLDVVKTVGSAAGMNIMATTPEGLARAMGDMSSVNPFGEPVDPRKRKS